MKRFLVFVLTFGLVMSFMPALSAEESVATSSTERESQIPIQLTKAAAPTSAESTSQGLFAGLALVFFVGGVIAWWLRRYSFANRGSDLNKIKVLNQHHLGPRKSLAIVQVAGESVLIGITEHHISHIRTLSLLSEEVQEIESGSFDQVAVNREINGEGQDEFKMRGLEQIRGGVQ